MEQTYEHQDTRSFEKELAGKYLSFRLKSEGYACPISPINDIIELQEITKVPKTAPYVKGVINLRGTVVPVIDLRRKFGMEDGQYDRQTCIIVVEFDDFQTGLIVDRVEEVLELADEQVDSAPDVGAEIQRDFIAGIGKLDNDVLILLNLERILTTQEKEELRQVQKDES